MTQISNQSKLSNRAQQALETINIPNARYDRVTEWRRDRTIPWDLAYVTGTLTSDISETLKAGTFIYGNHMTKQAWADIQARAVA